MDADINEFYKVNNKLNDLYLFTDLSKYKKGLELKIDPSEFKDLFKSLIQEGTNYKKRIVSHIKLKKEELEIMKITK